MKMKLLLSLMIAASAATNAQAQEAPKEGWTGQGEAGFISSSGNTDSDSLNLGLKFAKAGKVWDHEIGLAAYQASTEGNDTAENYSAGYTLKRNLTERSNIFFNLSYLDDEFDGFTEQLSAAIGYGYKFADGPKVKWEAGAGIGYRDTDELFVTRDEETGAILSEVEGDDLSGATIVLRSDFEAKISETTKFVDNFKAEIGSDNTYVENDAALFVAISSAFSLKAGLLVRFNSDPAEGSDDTDTITSLSLVYGF